MLDSYFARLGYAGPKRPSLAVLKDLCRLHPQTIAFENVAVAAGNVPDLALDAVKAKLITGRRGGYCYEHNTLFYAVLKELGFVVAPLAARVRYRVPPTVSTGRSHMVLRVNLPEGAFLADAGFGGLTLTAPVPMQTDEPTRTPHEPFRIINDCGEYLLQAYVEGDWIDVYTFDLARHTAADYETLNFFVARNPKGLFPNNLVATRPVENGRYSLFNRTLNWRPVGGRAERQHVTDVGAVLRDVFGLTLPEQEVEAAVRVADRGWDLVPVFG